MKRLALLSLVPLTLGACGSAPASVPPKLDLPNGPPMIANKRATAADTTPSPPPAMPPEPPRPVATPITVPPEIKAIVDATDRTEDDKKLDAGRHPGELIAFLGIKPGMRVAEMCAGTGYTTELIARAVGPKGKVWAQNTKMFVEKFVGKRWAERLQRPAMKNVVRVDRELEDPLPPDAKDLDIVVNVLVYHDTYWLKADRDKMNAAIMKALKTGGSYVIVDHSAREGTGAADVQTLHRIEEKTERQDIEHAGFKLAEAADFLRNPADTRDWNDAPMAAGDKRGTSDRFVLKFTKP
jgi:predicted methyltransferase